MIDVLMNTGQFFFMIFVNLMMIMLICGIFIYVADIIVKTYIGIKYKGYYRKEEYKNYCEGYFTRKEFINRIKGKKKWQQKVVQK